MPYSMFRKDGKYCVRNKDTGESKGCSATREMAVKHMRALYAAAAGETMGKKELDDAVDLLVKEALAEFDNNPDECQDCDETKETPDKTKMYYTGWSPATSYAELDALEMAQEHANEIGDLIAQFPMLATNILQDTEVTDKKKAIMGLAQELSDRCATPEDGGDHAKKEIVASKSVFEQVVDRFKTRITAILTKEKPAEEPEKSDTGFMIWKEADNLYHWISRYSNNLRDRDNPPEIIAAKSHTRFVDRVEKGLAPLPELWLWHRPEWKIGQATWVATDQTKEGVTFALAGGYFTPGLEQVAEWLSTKEDALVSHGMPPTTISRDPNDPSIIIEHDTREISPLPGWAAANEFTGFIVNKEAEMPIPAEKRADLLEKWHMPEDLLVRVEKVNKETAQKAINAGIESKEVEAVVVETPAAETPAETETVEVEPAAAVTEVVEAKETAETPLPYPTREEIADALTSFLKPMFDQVESLTASVEALTKEVSGLRTVKEEEVKEIAAQTPLASLSALLNSRAVGHPDTLVDGRSSLAKSHPKETKPVDDVVTGIPVLDQFLR